MGGPNQIPGMIAAQKEQKSVALTVVTSRLWSVECFYLSTRLHGVTVQTTMFGVLPVACTESDTIKNCFHSLCSVEELHGRLTNGELVRVWEESVVV